MVSVLDFQLHFLEMNEEEENPIRVFRILW